MLQDEELARRLQQQEERRVRRGRDVREVGVSAQTLSLYSNSTRETAQEIVKGLIVKKLDCCGRYSFKMPVGTLLYPKKRHSFQSQSQSQFICQIFLTASSVYF